MPYLSGVHTYVLPTTMGKDCACSGKYCLLVNSQFRLCTSLIPKPMTVVFGLGMRLCVCKDTNLENGILCNMPQSVVNDFFDHSEFEAINILNSHRAPCCNKH